MFTARYGLDFISNSTFCPHSVFMCFVWIWEQTAIISLYSINWLVYKTKMECVYCAVRTKYVRIINVNCIFKVALKCLPMKLYVDLEAQLRPPLTPALYWLAVSLILRFINPRCNNPGTQGIRWWSNANRSGRCQEHCTSAPFWNGTPIPQLVNNTIAVWTTTISHTVPKSNSKLTAFRCHNSKECAQ